MSLRMILMTILITIVSFTTSASESVDKPLAPDQAFKFEAQWSNGLVARLKMPAGYYLYKSKFHVNNKHGEGRQFELRGDVYVDYDEFFGEIEAFRNEVELHIPTRVDQKGIIEINVGYQGCKEGILCYPPQTKTIIADMNNQTVGWR